MRRLIVSIGILGQCFLPLADCVKYGRVSGDLSYSFESEKDLVSTHMIDDDGRYAFVTESMTSKLEYGERARKLMRLLEDNYESSSGKFIQEMELHSSNDESLVMFDHDRMLELIVGAGGPNCIQSGGGYAPPYQVCDGCMIKNALQCVEDMRFNVSGNVPSGCKMGDMLADIQPSCCAKFSRDETIDPNPGARIIPKTSAYNDALLCLHNAGCHYKKDTWGDQYKPVPFNSGTKNLFCYGNGNYPDRFGVIEESNWDLMDSDAGEHTLKIHTGDEVSSKRTKKATNVVIFIREKQWSHYWVCKSNTWSHLCFVLFFCAFFSPSAKGKMDECHDIYKNIEAECLMHTTHNDCKEDCVPIEHNGDLPSEDGLDCACWEEEQNLKYQSGWEKSADCLER